MRSFWTWELLFLQSWWLVPFLLISFLLMSQKKLHWQGRRSRQACIIKSNLTGLWCLWGYRTQNAANRVSWVQTSLNFGSSWQYRFPDTIHPFSGSTLEWKWEKSLKRFLSLFTSLMLKGFLNQMQNYSTSKSWWFSLFTKQLQM